MPSCLATQRRRKTVPERTRTAFHEAGHAVLSAAIANPPEHVTIRPDEHTLGRREMAGQSQGNEKYTVKKLGEAKILGRDTQHVLVTGTNTTTELWTAKDFVDYATFSRLLTRPGVRAGAAEALNKALKDAGADGMPLKSITTGADGAKMTMEVVKAEKQSLPASTFEIPAGYTKSAGGMMDMMGGMSGPQADEAKKRMDEAMKNMTPEQREMIQKMMKQRQGGNQ